MTTGMHFFFFKLVFSGYIPRNEIAESHGSSIFSVLRHVGSAAVAPGLQSMGLGALWHAGSFRTRD